MKIWEAELYLGYSLNRKWHTVFNFKLQEEDYEENKQFNEWIHFKNWISNRIPMSMIIEKCGYSGFRVVQGFDHELTEGELKELEIKMRKSLGLYLEKEKDNYLKDYLEKIKATNKQ